MDWMSKGEEEGGGGRRAEWIPDAGGGSAGAMGSTAQGRSVAWIWWKRPEEWADLLVEWVEGTGQRGSVLTVYELIQGEGTMSQGMFCAVVRGCSGAYANLEIVEFHGMDTDVMLRSLNVLVKRGKAQIFGGEGQEGVKFF